jgi:hypothetical protein
MRTRFGGEYLDRKGMNSREGSLCDLYSLRSIIKTIKLRRIRLKANIKRIEKQSIVYRLLVGKPEGKRLL